MTVHLLFVEDNDDFIDEFSKFVESLPGEVNMKIVRSRNEAIEQIPVNFFDLVILDLKIPTVSGTLDADPIHGFAVFNRIRSDAPGTPIFVLTGSSAEDFIPELLKNTQQIDIWSEGKETANIQFQKKYKINECFGVLRNIAKAIEDLSEIELDRGEMNLNIAEDRLIRIFTKKFECARCVATCLEMGLSGARVIRLRITDEQGVLKHDAVAKIAELGEVRREAECYDNFIAELDPVVTPRKLAKLEFGAHSLAGVFYGLAAGFEKNTFEFITNFPERANEIIKNIEGATDRWVEAVPETKRTIKEYRQRLLKDETFEDVVRRYALCWAEEFEERSIQTRWACIHGDLHGGNVLVSDQGSVVLIDYNDIGYGPASLDPIALELSVLFHPSAAHLRKDWPSIDQAKAWGNLGEYIVNCPIATFINECRQWTYRIAAGRREIAASAYSYLVRQLRYDDTDKELVLTLLKGIRRLYNEET